MDYKLENKNGKVAFLQKTGKSFVKNEMPVSSANAILKRGKPKKSNIPGFPINLGDKLFFAGELILPKKQEEERE